MKIFSQLFALLLSVSLLGCSGSDQRAKDKPTPPAKKSSNGKSRHTPRSKVDKPKPKPKPKPKKHGDHEHAHEHPHSDSGHHHHPHPHPHLDGPDGHHHP